MHDFMTSIRNFNSAELAESCPSNSLAVMDVLEEQDILFSPVMHEKGQYKRRFIVLMDRLRLTQHFEVRAENIR